MDAREDWIRPELDERAQHHLLRRLRVFPAAGARIPGPDGRTLLNFSSNDYLGLASHPAVIAAAREALETYGAGATASRLVCGTLPCHAALEERLAAWKGRPAALVFGSGYAANVGLLPAVAGRGDTVFADRLVHASLIDAIRLSGADLQRFRHNDADHLAELLERHPARGRRWVVTESVFSMDGDLAPLPRLAGLARSHGALLFVDEAHATGVFSPAGAGRAAELGLGPDVHLGMGTLSKALGGAGGYVACSEAMRDWLVNRARSFIYSTAPAPAAVGAALGALDVLQREPQLGAELLRRAGLFRERLQAAGLDTMASASQIVPVLVGEAGRALALSARLESAGILAVAIRPPTVPEGSARLRFSVTLGHTPDELDAAADAIAAAARAEGVA